MYVMPRVRLKIIRNTRIKIVGKYQPCMAYELLIIFKRTRIQCVRRQSRVDRSISWQSGAAQGENEGE
eukprot:COSAG05_NODE_20126_length_282_cov_14.031496_1_plen_67_part_10